MFKVDICLIASFHFLTFSPCMALCGKGFYGPRCTLNCSVNCRHGICKVTDKGIEECTHGCKPGFYGSRCKVPCSQPSVDVKCQECPTDCKDGFCDLETTCMTGCVKGYYGYNCTCDKTVGCHPGCGKDCEEPETSSFTVEVSTDTKLSAPYWFMLTAGAGIAVLVVVALVFLVKFMKKRKQPASSEYCRTIRQDRTEDYTDLKRSEIGSYIHPVEDHNDSLCEEEFV